MRIKSRLRLEIKEVSEAGTFEGLLSPYGNLDETGDVVEAGAFTQTLKLGGPERPLLWQHRTSEPIGKILLEDRPDGLWCKGELLMADSLAQRAYLFIKAGIVKGLSIGFESIRDEIRNGVRFLKEIKLYEGSVVTFPANTSALIASVKGKGENKSDFNDELAEIQLSEAGCQMRCALWRALDSITWSNLGRDEKISGVQAVIQQFADAYTAYFPMYLDMLTEKYGGMETWDQKRFETKEGRKISAATMETMKSGCSMVKSGHDLIYALLTGDADEEDSTETKAGSSPVTSPSEAATKSAPVEEEDHSAATSLIGEIRALIPA